jgi:excisionase family DNA binding protein
MSQARLDIPAKVLLEQEVVLSVQQACRVIGIGKTLAYELIGTGRLRCVRAGRRVLIPTDEVKRFMAEQSEAGEQ